MSTRRAPSEVVDGLPEQWGRILRGAGRARSRTGSRPVHSSRRTPTPPRLCRPRGRPMHHTVRRANEPAPGVAGQPVHGAAPRASKNSCAVGDEERGHLVGIRRSGLRRLLTIGATPPADSATCGRAGRRSTATSRERRSSPRRGSRRRRNRDGTRRAGSGTRTKRSSPSIRRTSATRRRRPEPGRCREARRSRTACRRRAPLFAADRDRTSHDRLASSVLMDVQERVVARAWPGTPRHERGCGRAGGARSQRVSHASASSSGISLFLMTSRPSAARCDPGREWTASVDQLAESRQTVLHPSGSIDVPVGSTTTLRATRSVWGRSQSRGQSARRARDDGSPGRSSGGR